MIRLSRTTCILVLPSATDNSLFVYCDSRGAEIETLQRKIKMQQIQSHGISEIEVMKTAKCFHHKQTDS